MRALVTVHIEHAFAELVVLHLVRLLRIDGDARQAVAVDGVPVVVAVLRQVAVIDIGHAVAGVPSALVLAVERLVILDAARRESQPQRETRSGEHLAVHHRELFVVGSRVDRRDGRIGQECTHFGNQLGRHGGSYEIAQRVGEDVVFDNAHHAVAHLGFRDFRHLVGAHQDAAAGAVVGHARNLAATGHIHKRSFVDQRQVSILHPAAEHVRILFGQLPLRAVQQRGDRRQVGEHAVAVAAGVGNPAVLYERAVFVEAVARIDVFEFGAEAVHAHLDLRLVLGQDTAHDHRIALPNLVRAGGGSFIFDAGSIEVDRLDILGPLFGGQFVVERRDDPVHRIGHADDPVPPVAVGRVLGAVLVRVHPLHAVDHVLLQRVVFIKFGCGRRVSLGHVREPPDRRGHRGGTPRREAVVDTTAVVPQVGAVGGLVHRLPLLLHALVLRGEAFQDNRVGQVDARAAGRLVHVALAQVVERKFLPRAGQCQPRQGNDEDSPSRDAENSKFAFHRIVLVVS